MAFGGNDLNIWRLTVDVSSTRPISPVHVHAVVSSWVDDDHHAGRKPFSLGPIDRGEDSTTIEIRTFSARVSERLWNSFDSTERLRFGASECALATLTLESSVSFEDVLDASELRSSRTIHFRTPTLFRSGDRVSVFPTPQLVFGHARRVWTLWASPNLTPHIDLNQIAVLMPKVEGRTVTWDLGRRVWPGFVGSICYDFSLLDERDQRVLDSLTRLLPFVGVGANTTWGMGHVEVDGIAQTNGASTQLKHTGDGAK